jgi:hypothetical protein
MVENNLFLLTKIKQKQKSLEEEGPHKLNL